MMKKLFLIVVIVLSYCTIYAQSTVGMLQHDMGDADSGYILFAPVGSTTTYLIDKCGKEVHTWKSNFHPHLSVYLLPDGNLLRTANIGNKNFTGGGLIEKIDWDGNIVFSYPISSDSLCQHHDIRQLPNGNILVIAWEKKTAAEALASGRNPNFLGQELWSEKIIEIKPVDQFTYDIVWEWHAWDHMVQRYDSNLANYGLPKDHPELINLNYYRNMQADLLHFNSIDYNPAFDQILISVHTFDEIWVIDHSTTSAEAASHKGGNSGKGGDLLYRWGNPLAYNGGTAIDQKLFKQHDAVWLGEGYPHEGSIMVFNNGTGRPGGINYSTVDIISPPVNSAGVYNSSIPYGPADLSWTYKDSISKNFFSLNISGAQQLKNGNVLICDGPKGTFFEIDSTGTKLWKYVNPVSASGIVDQGTPLPLQNEVFRCTFYPSDYVGFEGHKLTSGLPVELKPIPYTCHLDHSTEISEIQNQPQFSLIQIPGYINISTSVQNFEVSLVNLFGQEVFSGHNLLQIPTSNIRNGLYLVNIKSIQNEFCTKKIIIDN